MSREKLDKETAARVENELPDVSGVRRASLELQPDIISGCFPQGSFIPIATACLQDATSVLEEARYALFEALAHVLWNREIRRPENESMAVFFGKFYADDAALRIYAAGEHLANAIANMLEIHKELKEYKQRIKGKNIVSKQALVGSYLIDSDPNNEVTKAILKLKESEEWKKTRKYRDDWVHGKPPIIRDLGIGYERRNRLKVSVDSIGITVGGGDEPHYSIDDLLGFIRPALFLLTETVTAVTHVYLKIVNQKRQKGFLASA
jgi:ribosomal protein S13